MASCINSARLSYHQLPYHVYILRICCSADHWWDKFCGLKHRERENIATNISTIRPFRKPTHSSHHNSRIQSSGGLNRQQLCSRFPCPMFLSRLFRHSLHHSRDWPVLGMAPSFWLSIWSLFYAKLLENVLASPGIQIIQCPRLNNL